MSGHTPAPWGILYAGSDEGMTAEESIAEEMPVVSVGPINYTEFAEAGTAIERSNARLIAAAPDLYDAAVGVLVYHAQLAGSPQYEALKKAADKVEGR